MTHTTSLLRRALCALLFVPLVSVKAQVIATTLRPNGAFDTQRGYLISNNAPRLGFQFLAVPFTYSGGANTSLDMVKLGLENGSESTYAVEVRRGADMNASTLLASWTRKSSAVEGAELFSFTSVGDVPLISGEQYWIAVMSGAREAGGWFRSLLATSDNDLVSFPVKLSNSTPWVAGVKQVLPAYEVTGRRIAQDVVPEPITALMTATGLMILGLAGRRRIQP